MIRKMFAAVAVTLLLLSCEPAEEQPVVPEVVEPDSVPATIVFEGTIFVQGTVNEDGVLIESERTRLDLGDAVQAREDVATWTLGNRELEMLQVVNEDQEVGFVYESFIAVDSVPAVLVREARVFSEGQDAGVTTQTLPPIQIVAVYNEEFDDNLVRIAFTPLEPNDRYVSERIYTVWVKADLLSTDVDDVKVAHLYYLQTLTDDPEQKMARLEIALETDSVFSQEIQTRLTELQTAEPPAETSVETVSLPAGYSVDSDVQGTTASTNVRSVVRQEPTVSSEAITVLDAETEVILESRSVEEATVSGIQDSWFLVRFTDEDGATGEGWIFGGLLDFERASGE